MTTDELIKRLEEYPSNTRVIIWDPDSDDAEDITGFLYDEELRTLEFCSDDIS